MSFMKNKRSSHHKSGKGDNVSGGKFPHSPDNLMKAEIPYTVKFLGSTEAEAPKGIAVIKSAIKKLKFNKDILKSQGSKLRKVDLIISTKGLKVQDLKTKDDLHWYPLHRISYCADDKADKRMFAFIGKDSNGIHRCFVFDSEKCAEEITLTVGQAFDLAYKEFLEGAGKELEHKKQLAGLKKKIADGGRENESLRTRVSELEDTLTQHGIPLPLPTTPTPPAPTTPPRPPRAGQSILLLPDEVAPPLPPRLNEDSFGMAPFSAERESVGGGVVDTVSNGTGHTTNGNDMPVISPPPFNPKKRSSSLSQVPTTTTTTSKPTPGPAEECAHTFDPFGGEPFVPDSTINVMTSSNPFAVEMAPRSAPPSGGEQNPLTHPTLLSMSLTSSAVRTQQAILVEDFGIDSSLIELDAAFSCGLTMATDDFDIDDLDPLKSK